jgi:hypothetical protein
MYLADDCIEMKGHVRLQLLRPDGSEHVVEIDNLVVTVGKNTIADRMKAAPTMGPMTDMAVGTGATPAAAGDTQLGAEVAGGRVALTSTGVVGAVITYIATFGPGAGTGALVEAGLFSAAAAGNMLARVTYAVINKAAADILNVTWTVTVG